MKSSKGKVIGPLPLHWSVCPSACLVNGRVTTQCCHDVKWIRQTLVKALHGKVISAIPVKPYMVRN